MMKLKARSYTRSCKSNSNARSYTRKYDEAQSQARSHTVHASPIIMLVVIRVNMMKLKVQL